MAGDTQSRHCEWLMFLVSLAHSISDDAYAGHNRTVVSSLADAKRRPSGLNATPVTAEVWPVSGAPTGCPVSASHSRTVVSSLADAKQTPVRAERHAGHRGGVAGERRTNRLAGVGVPQPHRGVLASRRPDDARPG